MPVCYIGLGSNLGDRMSNIERAVSEINKLKNTKVIKSSTIMETEPVGVPYRQGKFLNSVLKINTSLKPQALLKNFKKIEKEMGRIKSVPNAARIIDLDILLYADCVISNKDLRIPHPRMFERMFVVEPLFELL